MTSHQKLNLVFDVDHSLTVPVQTRIRSLADKLNGMQSGLHDANRREHLETKALELSERVVRSEQKEQQQFLLIKEKLKDFQGALKIEQEARLAVEDQLESKLLP